MRYRRRISLGKHIKLNIGKDGLSSVSFKIGGLTINPQRNTYSYNTPVKGLSLTGNIVDKEAKKVNNEMEKAHKAVLNAVTNGITNITTFIDACNECNVKDQRIFTKAEQIKEGLKCNIEALNSNNFNGLKTKNNTYLRKLRELRNLCKVEGNMHESVYKMIDTEIEVFKLVNKYIDILRNAKAKGVC